jgi:hypothetical protein
MCEQETNVTIQVLDTVSSDVIDLEEGMTVGDLKADMGLEDYTATINGAEAFDEDELLKYDFITLSPPEEEDLDDDYEDDEDDYEDDEEDELPVVEDEGIQFEAGGDEKVDFDVDVVDPEWHAEASPVDYEVVVTDDQEGSVYAEPVPGSEEDIMLDVEEEIRAVLNRYSRENASNTPDFILAQYLIDALNAWNKATKEREIWYGREAAESDETIEWEDDGTEPESV